MKKDNNAYKLIRTNSEFIQIVLYDKLNDERKCAYGEDPER